MTAGDWYFNTGDNTTRIYDGSAWNTISPDLVGDATPQLGGNLDVNSNSIVSTSNGDINITPNGTGDVSLGNFTFDADQTVGAGQDDYVLTYDNASGKIGLEASGGGITVFDLWNLETAHSNSGTITTGWAQMNTDSPGLVGTGMSEASGIFTFPSTGIYLVEFTVCMNSGGSDATIQADIQVTTDNSTYSSSAQGKSETGGGKVQMFLKTSFDVTDTSTHKCRFAVSSFSGSLEVESGSNLTAVYFTKIAET